MRNHLSGIPTGVEEFTPGQTVQTSFGSGIISAVSHVDSLLYVALSRKPAALYIFRPEQVEAVESLYAIGDQTACL